MCVCLQFTVYNMFIITQIFTSAVLSRHLRIRSNHQQPTLSREAPSKDRCSPPRSALESPPARCGWCSRRSVMGTINPVSQFKVFWMRKEPRFSQRWIPFAVLDLVGWVSFQLSVGSNLDTFQLLAFVNATAISGNRHEGTCKPIITWFGTPNLIQSALSLRSTRVGGKLDLGSFVLEQISKWFLYLREPCFRTLLVKLTWKPGFGRSWSKVPKGFPRLKRPRISGRSPKCYPGFTQMWLQ